jgi:hypothetical protein
VLFTMLLPALAAIAVAGREHHVLSTVLGASTFGVGVLLVWGFTAWRLASVRLEIDRVRGTVTVFNFLRTYRVDIRGLRRVALGEYRRRVFTFWDEIPAALLEVEDSRASESYSILVHAALRNRPDSPLLEALRRVCNERSIPYELPASGLTG